MSVPASFRKAPPPSSCPSRFARKAMFQALCKILLTALLATVLVTSAAAQSPESSGEAEVALQGYYFGTNSQTVTDTTGAAVSLQQFVPDVGILSLNLQDYGSRNGFQSG